MQTIVNNTTSNMTLHLVVQRASVYDIERKLHKIASGTRKIVLKRGKNSFALSKEEVKELLGNKALFNLVKEGSLNFPDIKEFSSLFKQQVKAAEDRRKKYGEHRAIKKKASPEELEKQISALSKQLESVTALAEKA